MGTLRGCVNNSPKRRITCGSGVPICVPRRRHSLSLFPITTDSKILKISLSLINSRSSSHFVSAKSASLVRSAANILVTLNQSRSHVGRPFLAARRLSSRLLRRYAPISLRRKVFEASAHSSLTIETSPAGAALLPNTERRKDPVQNIIRCRRARHRIQRPQRRVKINQQHLMRHPKSNRAPRIL